jgi:flagellar basal body rod protein FlgC
MRRRGGGINMAQSKTNNKISSVFMRIFGCYLFVFSMVAFNVNGQNSYDLSKISEEKLVIDSRLVTGQEDALKQLLLCIIEVSIDNIIRSNMIIQGPASNERAYRYLVVSSDFTFEVMEKAKIKLEYDPSYRADAIQSGELKGYLRRLDFDVPQECSDIAAAAEVLKTMDIIENGQQLYDLTKISGEKLIIGSRLITGHGNELRDVLIQAINTTLVNIANIDAIATSDIGSPFQYHFLVVSPDFSVEEMQKEKAKYGYPDPEPGWHHGPYDPYHKIAVYTDFDMEREYNDIFEMIVILGAMHGIEVKVIEIDNWEMAGAEKEVYYSILTEDEDGNWIRHPLIQDEDG